MSWPVVDDGLRLDVHRVVLASKRHRCAFVWKWTSFDGEPVGWITVAVTLDGPLAGTLRLTYNCNGVPFDQRFLMEAEPCRFGGVRWFAICAATGRRAAKLYSLGGAGFHSRYQYGRVAYRTQRAAQPIDRTLMRRDRILTRKLKSDDPAFAPKPKGMRWKTYDRLTAQLMRAEEALDSHLLHLIGRLGRLDP